MGQIDSPSPVLLIFATSSRHDSALQWTLDQASEQFGTIALESDRFDFTETDYYAASMGTDLKKQFLAFETFIDPAEMPAIKILSNQWEEDYANLGYHDEPRPLNLDPGYITQAKLVLASTKDHAHRIYLRDGIYAEVTLSYRQKEWQAFDSTFPDYQRPDYQAFFTECRNYLRKRLRSGYPEE